MVLTALVLGPATGRRGAGTPTRSGIDLAVSAARNYRHLRPRGRTVRKTVDCLIATFCLERSHALLPTTATSTPLKNS
jgi:hypothetical protein